MSREILFRIKDGNNKWVYGFPLVYDDGSFAFVDRNPLNELKPTEMCEINSAYNDTLGQFTGLTDKNGTKIFEGDILNLPPYLFDGERCVCVYQGNDTGMGFELMEIRKYCLNGYGCILSDEWEDFEIVGNIWDNPELLKED